jgi:hypothetical protein
MPALSKVGSTSQEAKHLEYIDVLEEAAKKMGRDVRAPGKWEGQLKEAGFTNIHFYWMEIPIGPWAKGEKNKLLGKLVAKNVHEGCRTVVPMLTRVLGWEMNKVDELLKGAQAEHLDPSYPHATYLPICFAYAQKPE